MTALGKDVVAARLGALATAAPETAEACELVASSLQSQWSGVFSFDTRASIDALSSARPDLPGWDHIRTILNAGGGTDTENYTPDNDYSQRDIFGTLYDTNGYPISG